MEAWNTYLLKFFDWLLWTTIQGSVLIVLIVLVQKILRRRLPVHLHYLLWLLLLVRLAVPWLPESRISVFNLVPRSVQQGRIVESYSQSRDTGGMGLYMRAQPAEVQQSTSESEAASVRFVRALPTIWLVGTVLIAVYVCVRSISLWRTVKRERPITDQKILDLLEDCKMQMRVETIVAVVVSDRIKSPALFGFVRPRLLLPQGMLETYGLEELRYVFIHELAHLKQRDIYLGWLMALLHVAHWFNPLMWFAFNRIRADREIACDRLAISTMEPDEPSQYGRTIVSLLESFSQTCYLPSVAGILEDSCQVERRIKMIADYRKTSRTRWTGALLLLTALACIVLTNAYVAKANFDFGAPVNLGPVFNTSLNEAAAIVSADDLSISFIRWAQGGLFDICLSTRATRDAAWGDPVNLGPWTESLLNEMPKGDVPRFQTADGLETYGEQPGEYGGSDLYVRKRKTKDEPWGTGENLGPVVNSAADDFSPSISRDGLELYFSSERPPGSGRQDLWVTKRTTRDAPWTEPVNLGPEVNSTSKDRRPCLSPDGLILFFESLRPGYGYGDLYMTRRASRSDPWQEAVNLGPLVNSSADEECPFLSADGSTLYFDSTRPGGYGGQDIYKVSILPVVDFNGDGKVDLKDLRILAQHWGQNDPTCDIAPLPSGDGIVDEKDLNLLAERLLKQLQPVAHWRFDETQGNVAADSTGTRSGTVHGNPVWQPEGGAVGGALQLDGLDDYVSTDFSLNPVEGSFSVFAWIKGGARGQVIISQRDTFDGRNTQPGSAWLWADSSYGRLITRLMHPPFDPLLSEAAITDDQWHHVGLVYDVEGLHRYLYVDGAEVAGDSNLVGGVISNGGLHFGVGPAREAGTFWSGLIDDIRIYDEVLSAEEVADLAR